jgi:hypothetical protein
MQERFGFSRPNETTVPFSIATVNKFVLMIVQKYNVFRKKEHNI